MKKTVAPKWQRMICGLMAAVAGIGWLALMISSAIDHRWPSPDKDLGLLFGIPYGVFLFAHVAWKGRLPAYHYPPVKKETDQ